MQDRPDAAELIEAIGELLFVELRPAVPRELRFKTLIAANACAIVARELRDSENEGTVPSFSPELAEKIRAGEMDDRMGELIVELREHARAKLAVANPGYDAFVDDPLAGKD